MQTSLEQAIREQLASYLAGSMSLDEFKDWLIGSTWDIEQRSDVEATDLTYEIKLLLAEQSTEDFSEVELQELLRPLAETRSVAAK